MDVRKKIVIASFVFFISSFSSCGLLSSRETLLIGKWEEYKKEWRKPYLNSSPSTQDNFIKLEFKKDHTILEIPDPGYGVMHYELKEDAIYLDGHKRYYIEKITRDEIILDDYFENRYYASKEERHYFKRVKNF